MKQVVVHAENRSVEDPSRAEEDWKSTKVYLRKSTKGYLRKRLHKASTKNANKRFTPDEAKKRRTLREAKKRKLFDPNTMAYADVLKEHIDGIVRSQSLGCMGNSMDHHDICRDPPAYVNTYFNDAMMLLDECVK